MKRIKLILDGDTVYWTGNGFTFDVTEAKTVHSVNLAKEMLNKAKIAAIREMCSIDYIDYENVSFDVSDNVDTTMLWGVNSDPSDVETKVETETETPIKVENEGIFSDKAYALATHLNCEFFDIHEIFHNVFEIDEDEYLVLTDDEAKEHAAEYIKYSLWAFNAQFIAKHSSIPIDAIKAILNNENCYDNNDIIEKIINDLDYFIEDAIGTDGRGHFISHYDGEEHSIEFNQQTFYIYRM